MKKLLIITNLLTLVIVQYMACKPAAPLASCTDKLCKDYSEVQLSTLSAPMAKLMSRDYDHDPNKRWVTGTMMPPVGDDIDDARSIWFDLETIKAFIWQIEDTLCKQGNRNCLKLGLRIYYAKYPEAIAMQNEEDLKGLDIRFAKRHTLFMVPTYFGDTANLDFNPLLVGNDKCKPTPFTKLLNSPTTTSYKHPALILSLTGGEYVLNHGDLAPPPKGEGTFGGEK